MIGKDRLFIAIGILSIAVTLLGARFVPPVPAWGAFFGIASFIFGLSGPSRRRSAERVRRTEARRARTQIRQEADWGELALQ